ncbi:myotubularin-related protein 2-like [Oscarella lobularis]|uniref:myotubularin-related protein 2-like n=1 Tax=Oscarella lobularis TaxID=121494 RepID=UPI0033137446
MTTEPPSAESEQELKNVHDLTQSSDSGVPLLVGERLVLGAEGAAKDVTYLCPYLGPMRGQLLLTTYKLYFQASEGDPPFCMDVPLGVISRIDKIGGATSKGQNSYGLEIHCKDMRNVRFAFKQEKHSRRLVYEKLQTFAFPLTAGKKLFAFQFQQEFDGPNGWDIYDAEKELQRQSLPTEYWKISHINKGYTVCETYPEVFAVPSCVTDEQIHQVATYRSRARIPVLSWIHPDNHASLTRCSQPMAGTLNKRSRDDENMLLAIRNATPGSHRYCIVDARPKINAVANMARGGGYESEDAYEGCELYFMDIANIHVMRESLKKMKDICYPHVDDDRWFLNLESTHWLEHIKGILSCAVRIVDIMERCRTSVVIHCSDGWDRTAQLSGLAMLLMDSYYRTIEGFEVLIEKEWISFGHKFQQRYGHGDAKHSDEQRAPIFLQFIDAVWQITQQFPCAFEFNDYFLMTILDHLYSCLFGTFLCNSDQQRKKEQISDKTVSLWTFVNSRKREYVNPLYSPELHNHVLFPVASMRRMKLWTSYYMRWNPRFRPQESEHERNKELFLLCELLREKVAGLQKEVEDKASATSVSATVQI